MQPDRRGLALAQGPGGISQQATVGIGRIWMSRTARRAAGFKKGEPAQAQRGLPRLDGGLRRVLDQRPVPTARRTGCPSLAPASMTVGRSRRAIGALDPGDHRQSEIAPADGGQGDLCFRRSWRACRAGLQPPGWRGSKAAVTRSRRFRSWNFRSDRCRVGLRGAPRHARPALCPGPGYSPMAGRD